MQGRPQFTAIIPTFNRASIVGRAIDSVLAQQYKALEIIVVDDGSTDETEKVLESYGDKIRRFQQANAGVSTARNRGVKEARCDWIAFLDSDDAWVPEHLSRMVEAIEATHGGSALYFADLKVADENGETTYWRNCNFAIRGRWQVASRGEEWTFLRTQPMMLQTSVICRAAYLELGGLAEELRTREDTLFFYELSLSHAICAVSGCGAIQHADAASRLTRAHDGDSREYREATTFMYRRLLQKFGPARPEWRKHFTECLASAHIDSGRACLRKGDYWGILQNLAAASRVSPSTLATQLFDSLRRKSRSSEATAIRAHQTGI